MYDASPPVQETLNSQRRAGGLSQELCQLSSANSESLIVLLSTWYCSFTRVFVTSGLGKTCSKEEPRKPIRVHLFRGVLVRAYIPVFSSVMA